VSRSFACGSAGGLKEYCAITTGQLTTGIRDAAALSRVSQCGPRAAAEEGWNQMTAIAKKVALVTGAGSGILDRINQSGMFVELAAQKAKELNSETHGPPHRSPSPITLVVA
jgi:hypothetical protein